MAHTTSCVSPGANVNGPGHGNEFHTHPGSFWSGTYYVDDGGIGEDPSLGGEFEIQDPRGIAPAMYAPLLAFNVPGGLAAGSSETISPKAGTMLMFPAWLSHAVQPYLGTRQRISIAFNLDAEVVAARPAAPKPVPASIRQAVAAGIGN